MVKKILHEYHQKLNHPWIGSAPSLKLTAKRPLKMHGFGRCNKFPFGPKMVGRCKKISKVKLWLYIYIFQELFAVTFCWSMTRICGQPLVNPTPRYRLYGQGHTAGDFGGQSPKSGRPKVI